MKDIKEYFSSPTKGLKKENSTLSMEPVENASSIVLVEENTKDLEKKRKRKRKKKRKHSDPAVNDVSHLFSNSLKLVSPGNTPEMKNVDIVVKYATTVTKQDDNKASMKENQLIDKEDSLIKKDAFQFMMKSRNKSIGLNSPGKELDNESSTSSKDNKEKLAARRQILANWSDQKGAIKRKRLEEDTDKIIDHKLKKRAKRLKNLLNVEENLDVTKSRKRRIRKLSSDSDFEENEDIKICNNTTVKKVVCKNLEIISNEKVKKNKTGNIFSFLKSENKAEKQTSSLQVNEKIVEISKTPKKKKNNLKNPCLKAESSTETVDLTTSLQVNEKIVEISKTTKQKKNNLKQPHLKAETSTETVDFTPKSWKMRIKMKIEENGVETLLRQKKKKDYHEDDLTDDIEVHSDAIEVSSESDYEESAKVLKSHLKMAPIFIKNTPKPKEDPTVIEARKQFLMSGIPSSLKKTIEKQNSVAEQQYDIFPTTSHIQQKCNNYFWNLSKPKLTLNEFSTLNIKLCNLKCKKLNKSHVIQNIIIDTEVKKVDKLKILNKIKSENTNYPVYKSFRQIQAKCGPTKIEIKTEKRKRGRKKKNKNVTEDAISNIDFVEYAMWTEKYKPKCSDDIIGNSQAINNLKRWLDSWKNFSQEICSKNRRRSSNSESEFETTDGDSRDSTKLPGKILVLEGPCGSGKSTAVYAICNELGFNVIELNASTKRTGKRLLQEIQEATQSHQVRNNDSSQPFQKFFIPNPQSSDNTEKKMCVLLVEDVDIVFEQDDGFISALIQLTLTSKRPIIVTTTDYDSIIVQKYLTQYEHIRFLPLSSHSLATWLQILCLCEGLYVSHEETGTLLEYNKGDVRKTLLQFQFWVQSGGQIVKNLIPIKIKYKRSSCEEQQLEADVDPSEITLTEDVTTTEEYQVDEHKNCIRSFEILEMEEPFKVPFYLNLGLLWWNFSNILNKQIIDKDEVNTEDLLLMTKIYDSLTYTDIIFKTSEYFNGTEPLFRTSIKFKDSLEVSETASDNECNDLEFVHQLTHTLVNGSIKNYTGNSEECSINFAMPDKTERRWRRRLQEYEDVYQDALPLSIERKSTALDYMPILRQITRSECCRATTNTKRTNRFRSYLKDLGVSYCNQNTNNIVSKVLTQL